MERTCSFSESIDNQSPSIHHSLTPSSLTTSHLFTGAESQSSNADVYQWFTNAESATVANTQSQTSLNSVATTSTKTSQSPTVVCQSVIIHSPNALISMAVESTTAVESIASTTQIPRTVKSLTRVGSPAISVENLATSVDTPSECTSSQQMTVSPTVATADDPNNTIANSQSPTTYGATTSTHKSKTITYITEPADVNMCAFRYIDTTG